MPSLKLLLLQVGVILIAARLAGVLFKKRSQPSVVGEMIAGILLGPSLLGWLAPGFSGALFPPASLAYLTSLSQLGLLLFMFLVGLELDLGHLKALGRAAVVTSQVSIVVPFILGFLFSIHLYSRLAGESKSFIGFALFMGSAMSVTAFPVLARILTEKKMLQSRVGSVALACAAVDDVTAWCILAGIIVIVRSATPELPIWLMIVGLAVFVLLMLFVARPLLGRLAARYERQGRLTHNAVAIILVVVLASGLATESLGVHALFGAFLCGVVMPRHAGLAHELIHKLETVIVVLFLPVYFAITGLRCSFFLIRGASMWLYCAIIIALAVAGKLGGSTVAARLNGMSWREAAAVGILMNTRGLVELVILNIGLELGILSQTLFSIMVLMALFTTVMTTPLVSWVYPEVNSGTRAEPS